MANTLLKQRVEWIDCAKGITMLLVLLGHSVFGVLRGAIFSFHMPLFFILSTVTYRLSGDLSQWRRKSQKAFIHLVVPALILFVLELVARLLLEGGDPLTGAFWKEKGLTLLFASGSQFWIGSLHIPRMGIPWFLLVLFMGRSLLDLLHLKLGKAFVPVCAGLSVAGVVIGQHQWLPLSLDVMLSSMAFLLVGYGLKGYDPHKRPVIGLLVVCAVWGITLVIPELMDKKYLEMSMRRYPLYPLCLVTALAGTLMVARVSDLIVRYFGWLKPVLLYIGEHSLMMLCVHTLDFIWEDLYTSISHRILIRAAARIVLDLAIFFVVVYIKNKIGKKERAK